MCVRLLGAPAVQDQGTQTTTWQLFDGLCSVAGLVGRYGRGCDLELRLIGRTKRIVAIGLAQSVVTGTRSILGAALHYSGVNGEPVDCAWCVAVPCRSCEVEATVGDGLVERCPGPHRPLAAGELSLKAVSESILSRPLGARTISAARSRCSPTGRKSCVRTPESSVFEQH